MEIFKKGAVEQMKSVSVDGTVVVAVHNGPFHADDVFSIALLRALAKEAGVGIDVVRTRDNAVLNKAQMRVDVGMVWDEDGLSFDHHQNDPRLLQPEGVKHAAIGLLAKWCMNDDFLKLFKERYLLGLEYQDNTGKTHEKYSSIGFAIQPFVPAFGESKSFDEAFFEALTVAETLLSRCIATVCGMLQAEEEYPLVIEEVLADGKIVIMRKWLPLQVSFHPELGFTICPGLQGGYTIVGYNGYYLNEKYRGLNGDALSCAIGHKGVFVHKSGFTATMCTLEGAKQLCLQSL